MILRVVWWGLMYNQTISSETAYQWMFWASLVDLAMPWLTITSGCCFRHRLLPLDIQFLDARIGRLMVIVISLLLTSGALGNWNPMSDSCRAQLVVLPRNAHHTYPAGLRWCVASTASVQLLAFYGNSTGILKLNATQSQVAFDRDLGTGPDLHAIHRAIWSAMAYQQFAIAIPAVIVVLAGKLPFDGTCSQNLCGCQACCRGTLALPVALVKP